MIDAIVEKTEGSETGRTDPTAASVTVRPSMNGMMYSSRGVSSDLSSTSSALTSPVSVLWTGSDVRLYTSTIPSSLKYQ